jgi:hypothetical protein
MGPRLSALLTLFGGLCSGAPAFEPVEDVQVHGFLSQGYFLTSANHLFGSSDQGGSLDFTEAGINTSWNPIPRLQMAVQGLFRRAGTGHESDLELDFALLDYTVLSAVDRRSGVRLGRFKNPIGFYNDTRDVAFTRPGILLPESIYFDRLREFDLSSDGAVLYGELQSKWGEYTLEFGTGLPRGGNLDLELAILFQDFPGSFESDLSYIGRLTGQWDGGRYKLALSGLQANLSYDPRPPGDLEAGTDLFEQLVVSAQYNAEHWSLTGEYARRFTEDQGFGPAFPDTSFPGEAYYLQGIYRPTPSWELLLRYDVFYANSDDRDGEEFEALTGIPGHNTFAEDWTVGSRYFITPDWMVAVEFHHVNGTGWLPSQDNPDPSRLEKDWNLFALQASYRF